MKLSETLNLSADKIREFGWGTGISSWDPKRGSGICLEGGIAAAMGVDADDATGSEFQTCPAYRAVMTYLQDDDRWRTDQEWDREYLFQWNDVPGRTSEEVIEVLRAAAVIEEARENAGVLETVGA